MVGLWNVPVEMSQQETQMLTNYRKAKLFLLLRRVRHELFDEPFQRELIAMYPPVSRGQPMVAPAMLAMVTLLQAALGASDREAVRCAAADSHWQIVLGTLASREAGFSQGTLFHFRLSLMATQMDRRLLERTIELAKRTKLFGARAVRAAFDASPLWEAARVGCVLIGTARSSSVRP